MNVKVLVISGSMGAGKTTVLGEASDVLAARAIPHAAIDLDAVAAVLLPDESTRRLATSNLAAIFENFVSAGIQRVLLAAAVESRGELQALSAAMSNPEVVVCRLLAPLDNGVSHPICVNPECTRSRSSQGRDPWMRS